MRVRLHPEQRGAVHRRLQDETAGRPAQRPRARHRELHPRAPRHESFPLRRRFHPGQRRTRHPRRQNRRLPGRSRAHERAQRSTRDVHAEQRRDMGQGKVQAGGTRAVDHQGAVPGAVLLSRPGVPREPPDPAILVPRDRGSDALLLVQHDADGVRVTRVVAAEQRAAARALRRGMERVPPPPDPRILGGRHAVAGQVPRVPLRAAVLRRPQLHVAPVPRAHVQLQRAHRGARCGHVRAVRRGEQGDVEENAGAANREKVLRGRRPVPVRRVSDGQTAEQPQGSRHHAV
mmetsp:Transcript_2085/g.8804  ORF Transcript_2085/g.8804 Transcript_2085/m.8804 type:complete len:289 (-) Transcript_2085:316-1182(-)